MTRSAQRQVSKLGRGWDMQGLFRLVDGMARAFSRLLFQNRKWMGQHVACVFILLDGMCLCSHLFFHTRKWM